MGALKYYNSTTSQWEYIEDNRISPVSFVYNEIPAGDRDGSNPIFTLSKSYLPGTTNVYVNGLLQRLGIDYSEPNPSAGIIILGPAPNVDDDIRITYQHSPISSGNADTLDGYHANATATPNNIPVLDSTGKLTTSMMPTDVVGYMNRQWNNMTSSRAINTNYTNDKSYSIDVSINADIARSTLYRQINFEIDGVIIAAIYLEGTRTDFRCINTLNVTVPAGKTYKAGVPTGSGPISIYRWAELS